jgi:hypothetical protein
MEITSKDFSDELFLRLSYDAEKQFDSLSFTGCTDITLKHRQKYQKLFSVKEYFLSKIPCFVRRIRASFVKSDDGRLFQFVLDLDPLEVLVVCREFVIKDRGGDVLFSVKQDTAQKKRSNVKVKDVRTNAVLL